MISEVNNSNKIKVVSYSSAWPRIFAAESIKIKKALGSYYVSIHHIGSTSVPGLAAKPKIDIIAGVNTLTFDYKNLQELNYEYVPGFNIPFRRSFVYRSVNLNINLHIFEENDPEIELNLLFRDYLRKCSKTRNQYSALKYRLLEIDSSHEKSKELLRGYTLGKHDLIQDILKKTNFKRLRIVICTHYTEWEFAKNLRNKYSSRINEKSVPFVFTSNSENHKHFILYHGTNIVGYAHIHLYQTKVATLCFFAIEKDYKGNGFGTSFIKLLEKWIKLEGYKSIYIKNSLVKLEFFQHFNFIKFDSRDLDSYEGNVYFKKLS